MGVRVSRLGLWSVLLAGCASGTPAHVASPAAELSQRAAPPADLDARLLQHYPLRGFVLSESGFARVAFNVAASGAVSVGETLKSSRPAYAAACRRMLEGTTWKPALDRDGKAMELSATFDCVFEYPSDAVPRSARSAVAKPPFSRLRQGLVRSAH